MVTAQGSYAEYKDLLGNTIGASITGIMDDLSCN